MYSLTLGKTWRSEVFWFAQGRCLLSPLMLYTCYFQLKFLIMSLYAGCMRRGRGLSLGGAYKWSPLFTNSINCCLLLPEWKELDWAGGVSTSGLYLSLEASSCTGNLWWWEMEGYCRIVPCEHRRKMWKNMKLAGFRRCLVKSTHKMLPKLGIWKQSLL